MPSSCRDVFDSMTLKNSCNASQLSSYYLKESASPDERRKLFIAMQYAAEHAYELYKLAFTKRQAELSHAKLKVYMTEGRLIAGLGAHNILETGLTMNRLYGVPMISGSSLKGITANYCSCVLGAVDENYRGYNIDAKSKPRQEAGGIYAALFGRLDDEGKSQEGGFLRFYDAWIVPPENDIALGDSFVMDVMTPHHTEYYSEKAGYDSPTCFDAPIPVSFLAVKGAFEVRIGCDERAEPDAEKRAGWIEFAHKILEGALRDMGIGSKTRGGYGRMRLRKV